MGFPYHSEALSRTDYDANLSRSALEEVAAVLLDDRLRAEVNLGNVTVAMIRPGLYGSTIDGHPDTVTADKIEGEVGGLGVMAKFAVRFDSEAVDSFYDGQPKNMQSTIPPERHSGYANRWEELCGLMTSGPATVLLLHSPQGDAIQRWRGQIGHRDVIQYRDPTTIRGKFGLDNYNNLVHGSDSIASAHRELDILTSLLVRQSVAIAS